MPVFYRAALAGSRAWLVVGVVAGRVLTPVGVELARAQVPRGARVLTAPPPARTAGLKVLLVHDMECLAGQADWRTFVFEHKVEYAEGQKLLAADVNAVIDGLVEAGAETVRILDRHGSSNPEPDLPPALLHPRAKHISLPEPIPSDSARALAFDAVVVVGAHAKSGTGGFAAHSFSRGTETFFNGMSITEAEFIGYTWGQFGVPMILATGDDRLKDDLRTMPWIEYVTVKRTISSSQAELRPADEVHAEMRVAAKRALENRARAKVMKLTMPITITVSAAPPASLGSLRSIPGVRYSETGDESRVTFVAPSFARAVTGLFGLLGVASQANRLQMLTAAVRKHPDGPSIMLDYLDSHVNRWLEYESGRTPRAAGRER